MEEKSEQPIPSAPKEKMFISTRIRDAEPDTFDPNVPRLGRRESEPHSEEVTYLHDVLTTKFPEDRTTWDLHHYFKKEGLEIDIQFDISFFKDLNIPYTLSSYNAADYNNKVPTMAINILSKSTWRSDIAEKLDYCKMLQIPLYIIYPTYHVTINIYRPPFLRVYILQDNNEYRMHELRDIIKNTKEGIDEESIIDLSEVIPLRVGLKELEHKHEGEKPKYRLIFLKADEDEILLTESEKKDKIIAKQGTRIDEQSKRINEQSKRINELEIENKKLKERLPK